MTDDAKPNGKKGLMARLDDGPVLCAEGYLFELERRGYVQAGPFVPDVVLDYPEAVRQLHIDFARAGSDIIEAFTYYAHREKVRLIGREDRLEEINRTALALAKEVADQYGCLFAGDICNTNIYDPSEQGTVDAARGMFAEQVGWAVDAGADLIVAETFSWTGEALLALEEIRKSGLPAVVTVGFHRDGITREGHDPIESLQRLRDAGAEVVGMNCHRGPATMLPLLQQVRQALPGHIAALPVAYRTHEAEPTFQSLTDPAFAALYPEGRAFPVALDAFMTTRYEMGEFARQAYAMGCNYIGGCCGTAPHHVRGMAEALGRRPDASKYSVDMTKHAFFGNDPSLKQVNQEYAAKL